MCIRDRRPGVRPPGGRNCQGHEDDRPQPGAGGLRQLPHPDEMCIRDRCWRRFPWPCITARGEGGCPGISSTGFIPCTWRRWQRHCGCWMCREFKRRRRRAALCEPARIFKNPLPGRGFSYIIGNRKNAGHARAFVNLEEKGSRTECSMI